MRACDGDGCDERFCGKALCFNAAADGRQAALSHLFRCSVEKSCFSGASAFLNFMNTAMRLYSCIVHAVGRKWVV